MKKLLTVGLILSLSIGSAHAATKFGGFGLRATQGQIDTMLKRAQVQARKNENEIKRLQEEAKKNAAAQTLLKSALVRRQSLKRAISEYKSMKAN